ncbi:hypothetical protein SBA4_1750017 [Candidatus Sulfopaludibacter sp. SbA4]|nr:hypothetical protein SBA4_1750017 [Candidatus Sulfopaludibacter sp. SbA4]
MTLLERFRFYKEINAAPLAYYFARYRHVAGSYTVPQFLVLAWIGGRGSADESK